MKIEAIQIVGFGRWTNTEFKNLANFNVFLGANEAGKSTLRAFVLGILFGFPSKNSKQKTYIPHNGSQYGGHLIVKVASQRYRISRLGRTASVLKVTNLDNHLDVEHPKAWLSRVLGPVDYRHYQEVFSFNQHELAGLDQLTGRDFQTLLLNLGAPSASRLLQLSQQLDKEADQYFARTANGKRPLNQAVNSYQKQLAVTQGLAEQLPDQRLAQQVQAKLTARLTELEAKQRSVQSQKEQQRQLLGQYQLYDEAQRIGQQLERFTTRPVSRDDFYRAEALEQQLQQAPAQDSTDQSDRLIAGDSKPVEVVQEALERLRRLAPQVRQDNEKMQEVDSQGQELQQMFTGDVPKPLSPKTLAAFQHKNILLLATAIGSVLTIMTWTLAQQNALAVFLLLLTLLFGGLSIRNARAIRPATYAYAPLNPLQIQSVQVRLVNYQNSLRAVQADQARMARQQEWSNLLQQLCQHFDLTFLPNQLWQTYENLEQKISLTQQVGQALEVNAQKQQNRDSQEKQAVLTELHELYQLYQVQDLSQLRALLIDYENQQRNQQRYHDLRAQIGTSNLQQLAAYSSQDGLKEELEQLSRQEQALRQEYQEVTQELAQQSARQNQFIQHDSYGQALQDEENQRTALLDQFTVYLGSKLAAASITASLNDSGRTQWPKMQELAQRYFQTLTLDAYQRIDFIDNQIRLTNREGEGFLVTELSTGTRDQLYIALRLALVVSLEEQVDLPILVDDGFVNFDQERQSKMLRLLEEIAKRHQVLYFTKEKPDLTDAHLIDLKKARSS